MKMTNYKVYKALTTKFSYAENLLTFITFSYLEGKNTAKDGEMLHAKLVFPVHDFGLLKLTDSHLTRASS